MKYVAEKCIGFGKWKIKINDLALAIFESDDNFTSKEKAQICADALNAALAAKDKAPQDNNLMAIAMLSEEVGRLKRRIDDLERLRQKGFCSECGFGGTISEIFEHKCTAKAAGK